MGKHSIGSKMYDVFSTHLAEIDNPLIKVRNLTKTYGKGDAQVNALNGVDLDIAAGQLTAVMGPSGSGKSTLMHCVVGLESATEGSVVLNGKEITKLNERKLTQMRRDEIGFIFQSFNLIPTLNAQENIKLPATIAGKKIDPEFFQKIVDTVGLSDRLTHRPSELSGGQQQRVACARAMMTQPAVILADEPTGNLDSTATAQILNLLRTSVDELGQTVVMVTHEAEAAMIADRVIFLNDGKVVGEILQPTKDTILDTLKDAKNFTQTDGE